MIPPRPDAPGRKLIERRFTPNSFRNLAKKNFRNLAKKAAYMNNFTFANSLFLAKKSDKTQHFKLKKQSCGGGY